MNKSKIKNENEIWIAYVSTFPPRECGIATFTEDITTAMDDLLYPMVKSKIVAMNNDDVSGYKYSKKVIFQINQERLEEYVQTAEKINQSSEICMVNVQHEFGIFGGEYGLHIISFLEALTKPVVLTFHSVLPGPCEKLRDAVIKLSENVNGIMVMTQSSQNILEKDYGINGNMISVIPHGIHPRPYSSSKLSKSLLGFSNRTVLSTFGLLSRGKGLEYVIESLPEVVKKFPKVIYIILGVTHPNVLKQEGESYRNSLVQRIHDLGLSGYVKFYNRYFDVEELLQFLKATDIYISPSLDPNQSVSGTLSYALGNGRPVVSTAFAQAREDVTDEVGFLVDFKNPPAYTDALNRILENDELRLQMGKNAYFRTRKMIWPNVAIEYLKCFSEYADRLSAISAQKNIPKINLDHMGHLTDNFGIVQFGKLSNPDPAWGYTLDDNARALIVSCICSDKYGNEIQVGCGPAAKRDLPTLMKIYLDFIEYVSKEGAYFDNYVDFDKTINSELNKKDSLEDANGRALFALAQAAVTVNVPEDIRSRALNMIKMKIKNNVAFESPRAMAFYIKALCLLLSKDLELDGIDANSILRELCGRLVSSYEQNGSPEWQWFEGSLTYSNGVLPEALLLSYMHTKENRYLEIGRATLDFLIKNSFIDGIYVPIGQAGWCQKDGVRNFYDQQPEDVQAMVYALSAGFLATGEKNYNLLMHRAFCWFLGDNSIKQVVYDRTNGGCYDGLGKKYINLNQGAESTLAYLMARLCF